MKVNNKFLNIESKSKKSQIEKEIHEFDIENFKQTNKEKCKKCIINWWCRISE